MAITGKKNLEALKRARKKIEELAREKASAKIAKEFKEASKLQRTGKAKGPGDKFILKGKPKTIEGQRPNFQQVPKGTGVPVKRKQTLPTGKVSKKGKDLIPFKDPNVFETTSKGVPVKKISKTIGKKLLKGALGVAGMFFQEGVGESKETEKALLKRGELAAQLAKSKKLIKEQTVIEDAKANIEQEKQVNSIKDAALAEKALPLAIEKLNKDPNISQDEKESVAIKASSPKALLKTSKELNHTEDSEQTQSSTLADSFKEALTFFAPQLIGGLIGGQLEGEAGVAAGMEQGGKARDAFLVHKKTQAELEIKRDVASKKSLKEKRDKIDITPDFQAKGTQEPVFSRQNAETGLPEFINDKGEIIPSNQVESIKSVGNRLRQQAITNRQGVSLADKAVDRIDRSFKTFTSKKDVGRMIEANDTMDPIINLLESKLPITAPFLAPFIARGVQKEVGNLSETDLRNARVPLDVASRLQSDAKGFLSGDMTTEERSATLRLLKFMHTKNNSQLKTKIKGYSTEQRSKRLGLSKEDVESQLSQEVGNEEEKAPKRSGKKLMSNTQRKRLDELRKKHGRQ